MKEIPMRDGSMLKISHLNIINCIKRRHVLSLFLLVLIGQVDHCSSSQLFLPSTQINREIASAAPEEEVLVAPVVEASFLGSLFLDDDAGIMQGMRESLSDWERKEEFARQWSLENRGIFKTPSAQDKRKMVLNKLLKYADKRLSGEMKNAKVGSTLHAVGKVEKSLRPNTQVQLMNNIQLKLKFRALQGKATADVQNPWMSFQTTLGLNGHVRSITQKEWKEWQMQAGFEFKFTENQNVAFVQRKISENIFGKVSSVKRASTGFLEKDADKRLEIIASFPFNL